MISNELYQLYRTNKNATWCYKRKHTQRSSCPLLWQRTWSKLFPPKCTHLDVRLLRLLPLLLCLKVTALCAVEVLHLTVRQVATSHLLGGFPLACVKAGETNASCQLESIISVFPICLLANADKAYFHVFMCIPAHTHLPTASPRHILFLREIIQ